MEESGAEKLMNTLISKMESMDNDVQILKAENVDDPSGKGSVDPFCSIVWYVPSHMNQFNFN